MIFLIVVVNGYVFVTLIGAEAQNLDFCFHLNVKGLSLTNMANYSRIDHLFT